MKIGYARVSTEDQDLTYQKEALLKAGCERIFEDTVSGAKAERRGLTLAFEHLRPGDILIVWRLDRLGRSMKDLIAKINELGNLGVSFMSLNESMDTSTSSGRLVFNIFASLAEFERDLIRERTQAGLASARARGRVGGRKPKLTKQQVQVMKTLYESEEHTVEKIVEQFGIHRNTFYGYRAKWLKA